MNQQELIFLGLLKESPKHGYEIKLKIKEILSLFAGVELKSIYYPLRLLEKTGFVTKHAGKAGRRPQRFVYSLTPKGEARFKELLNKSFLNFNRPHFSLDLSLYFLGFVKPPVAKRRLRARMSVLKNLSQELRQSVNSIDNKKSSLGYILEHNLQMVDAEYRFLSSLTKRL